MSITDELRKEARGFGRYVYTTPQADCLTAIADRIDAEHERECKEQYACGVEHGIGASIDASMIQTHGYIELPKDADGEYIHVGDKVTCARSVWQVTGLRLTGLAWGVCCTIFNDHGGSGTNVYPPCDLRHYHAPTVEDVLTEFGIDWEHESDCEDRAALLKEYAAKLRLAEGEDA